MGEILKTWLRTRLGVVMDLRPEVFGHYTTDGTLLAQILHSYDIINSSQLGTIVRTQDPALARVNLKHLRVWLRFIGVHLDDEWIEEISHGKGTTALQLFYKVYLTLENKDRLHFITLQKEREKYIPASTKFDVSTVSEDAPPYEPSDHPLSRPLVDGAANVQWHRGKYQSIVEACERERARFAISREHVVVQPVESRPDEATIDPQRIELDELDRFARKHRVPKVGKHSDADPCRESIDRKNKTAPENPTAAKAYVSRLKSRRQRVAAWHGIKAESQKVVLSRLWEKLLEKQDDELDDVIAGRAVNQSQYEKQMMTKLCEIRRRKDLFARNRRIVDGVVLREREKVSTVEMERAREAAMREADDLETQCRRMCELRKRLREEKLKKLRERHRRICAEVMSDIADMAARMADCAMANDGEVPSAMRSELKALFLRSQPIFALADATRLVRDEDDEDEDAVEEVLQLERERQEALGDADFDNYHNLDPPWRDFAPELDVEQQEVLRLGGLVLGYVVHKLLEFVYPYPVHQAVAVLPKVKVSAVVLGLPRAHVDPLRLLLNEHRIRLVGTGDAINYCLVKYKTEMADYRYIDTNIIAATEDAVRQLEAKNRVHQAELARKRSSSVRSTLRKRPRSKAALRYAKPSEEKHTQTPREIPYDDADPLLTHAAYIGKWAYEFLTLGQPISDELSAKIVVEYLKSLKDVDGWALVNYPDSYDQLARLEFELTGRRLPPVSKVDQLEDVGMEDVEQVAPRIVFEAEEFDTFAVDRQSKLLPNPIGKPEDRESSRTFMTTYVRAIRKPEDLDADDGELYEVLPEDATPIDNFYAQQNVAYVAYYTEFDVSTLKRLARLVIGDISLTRKPSLELFGEALLGLEPKKKSGSPSESKTSIVKQMVVKSTASCEGKRDDEVEARGKVEEGDLEASGDRPIKPGEEGWTWAEAQQSPILLDALATLWENLEEVYIDNLKEIFFLKRIHSIAVVPYKDFVVRNMREFVDRPDTRQDLLHGFHRAFNEVDEDIRDDVDVKCELHCRVADFQSQLWEMCDQRRLEAEEERVRVIRKDWTHLESLILINVYAGILQTEVDRFVDTVQLIQDYYASMLGKPPQESRLSKITLDRIVWSDDSGSRASLEQRTSRDATGSKADHLRAEVAELLIDTDKESFDLDDSSVHRTILENVRIVRKFVDTVHSKVVESLKKEEASVSRAGKEKSGKKSPANESYEKSRGLVQEWRYAVLFEVHRMRLRLEVMSGAARSDANFLLGTMRSTFHRIRKEIVDRYKREIKSVEEMANVFCFAIEEARPIQEELLLDGDRFVVRSNVLMFDRKEPGPPPSSIKEAILPWQFQMAQLGRLMDTFMSIAPSGSLAERSLVFVLQDMVSYGLEQCGTTHLPSAWLHLRPCDVSNLVRRLFADAEYVEWREFIVYAMDLPTPTDEQILQARDHFRARDPELKELITRDQYHDTPLWFFEYTGRTPDVRHVLREDFHRDTDDRYDEERESEERRRVVGIVMSKSALRRGHSRVAWAPRKTFSVHTADLAAEETARLVLAKELLCQLFLASRHAVNYTALLLAFCKDDEPRRGLAKAFSLALGQRVCSSVEEGERFVDETRSRVRAAKKAEATRDLLREEAVELAKEILDVLLDRFARGLIITEEQDDDDLDYVSGRRIMIQELNGTGKEIDPSELLPEAIAPEQLVLSSSTTDSDDEGEGPSGSSLLSQGYRRDGSDGGVARPAAYWLPRDVCLTVLAATLPWHARQRELFDTSTNLREAIGRIYRELWDEELNGDRNLVLAHRFLRHPFVVRLLESTSKFTTKRVADLLDEIVRERDVKSEV